MDPNATLAAILAHLYEQNGDYDECLYLIESLADWMNRGGFAPASEEWFPVIIGAYWYCVNYYAGQSSDEYRTQCVLGQLYSPGPMCNGPDDGEEQDIYDALVALWLDVSLLKQDK